MGYAWRTRADGLVLVDAGDGRGLAPLWPADAAPMQRVASRWAPRVAPLAAAARVPLPWALAVITQESAGDPRAESARGAVGLMQLLPSTAQLSRAALLDWRTNVRAGLALLAHSRALGFDLPASASRYNAGAVGGGSPHPSAGSPWGLREQPGYISGVVGAANYFTARGVAVPASPGGAAPACLRALADADAAWPGRSRASDGIMGDAAHSAHASDHNSGLAVDITHDPGGCRGELVAALAARDPRTRYVIWSRHILAPGDGRGWRPYVGANPHETHVHISVRAALRGDVRPWPWSPRAASRAGHSAGNGALFSLLLLWRFLQ